MSEYYRAEDDESGVGGGSKKKYAVLAAVGIVIAAVLLMFSGMLDVTINDEPVASPKVEEDRLSVLIDLPEIMDGLDVPEVGVVTPALEEIVDDSVDKLDPIERGAIEDAQEGDTQSLTELAMNMLVDTREEFGLTDEPADDSGLTMEDILGADPPDPEDVAEPGADILETVEEFKKIPPEPVPDGATSGTITWVLTGNTININEVIIHLTGVLSGGVGDRDDLMRECPRDTLALYTLDGRTDPEGNKYGKVWCYGYPPTQPETSVNNILK